MHLFKTQSVYKILLSTFAVIFLLTLALINPSSVRAEPTLQQVFDSYFGPGVIDTTKETGKTTFPAGTYVVTLIAKNTAVPYAPNGWYPIINNTQFNEIFSGNTAPLTTKKVTMPGEFGLWIKTFSLWRSQPLLNGDRFDHFVVFDIPGGGYAIGIEDYPYGGDADFQDHILAYAIKQQPSFKTPLILIPGIGGSELKVNADTIWNKDNGHGGTFNRAYAKDEKVWVNEGEVLNLGEDDYFDVLRMKNDGIDSEAGLGTTGNVYSRAYDGAINLLISNGYILNKDLFVFPYDWRKDVRTTKMELDSKISQIKSQTGSQKVDIVAHSMGGLVARNYIADPAKAQNVRKLFTLGTPYLGSVRFLKALRFGDCLFLEIGSVCPSLAPSEVNDVLQNMISGFQLAPSQAYFNFYSDEDNEHPYPYRTEDGTLNYNQIKSLLTNFSHNTSLFNPSETFHSLDNNLSNTNGVDVTIVAGSGVQTLGQIIEETITTLNGNKITYRDKININGDGTVPLLSASISDPHKGLFLNGAAQVFYTNQEHGRLVFSGPALDLIKNILGGNNQLPNGVSTQPFKLSGHGLSVHSPVNLHVYDGNGNHTGITQNGDFETNIPGSSYETLGDAKFIWLSDNGIYTLKFEATSQGTFDFRIRSFADDINNNTILYKNIPLTTNTKAETVFNTVSTEPPILQVDNDGNGSTDTQVSSTSILIGSANYDQTPPQTTVKLEGIKDNNGTYKTSVNVVLTASDEASGSGVNKIEYSTDSGKTVQIYKEPILISQEGIVNLKIKAIDNAGNEELPQEMEIKIDKTPPTKLQAVKYKWGQPSPGYTYAKWPIFESWQQVFIQNIGVADAYNVKATIASTPPNVQIVKGVVDLGNIVASQSAWSQNNFQIKTDMAHPVDRCWGITWKIEYDDVFGAHYILPNIPQFPPGQAPGGCS
ncbi:alpha/beta hydrolase [Patescibacteria group bacterium]|nr:alpha/beta hydrolase [Patescibacteria group bacterium]